MWSGDSAHPVLAAFSDLGTLAADRARERGSAYWVVPWAMTAEGLKKPIVACSHFIGEAPHLTGPVHGILLGTNVWGIICIPSSCADLARPKGRGYEEGREWLFRYRSELGVPARPDHAC
jgi:hypothetical protein